MPFIIKKPSIKFSVFIFLFLSLSITDYHYGYSQSRSNHFRLKRIINYASAGMKYYPTSFRKDSQSAVTLLKFYINPNGSTDSILVSHSINKEYSEYIRSMNKNLVAWNRLLVHSKTERTAIIPLIITPLDVNDSLIKMNSLRTPNYLARALSFDQADSISFKERIFFLPAIIVSYYAEEPTPDIFRTKVKKAGSHKIDPHPPK